ncbi:MAG: UDP-N-acetylglucosamine 2-epimerase (non-hydrolyzing) [Candidatus Yanofskybacteria bacterium CG10_big_fil_rev_8_21_14_0_10_37_15]|uniref:UDP-N-acetylglucosamine 2-epimerase (Non-hydrolyzing) n=1 Tax=Candidatus Yanofskybacteria bacterium CG10_big_fil_rev_8_21_14_0_10_37_15 TaxID=1975097 RepID=A0A2H0R797_9BACT|nr:MAG: UDP-N-acetylglucosamine 2-epimerase (non-hydrolyzing) [Candidatus Yanofskybacteria bacterium CG10_big_fil_rev_8_21_14_0_10_37_15]
MTIFGTRPEIIKLSAVLDKLDQYVDHITVHTGQSYDYEMSKVFFDELNVRKPDYFLNVKAETLGEQLSNIIYKSEKIFIKEKPDALLVLGDTNSALSVIVAKRMKIPIFHMEAGNRSFDENVPEEINRRIIDHISDINLPYSEHARANLAKEGIRLGNMYATGSPMAEILEIHKKSIDHSNILKKLGFLKNKYFVVSIHREENVDSDSALNKLLDSLNAVAETYKLPILVSTHPRTAKRLQGKKYKTHKLIIFHKPLGFFDYVNLQQNAFCTISDSGTVPEEASILGFPAIQARVSSERPEAYDEGVLILSGLDKDIILKSIEIVTKEFAQGYRHDTPNAYKGKNVSNKVLRTIVGLTKIIGNKYRK